MSKIYVSPCAICCYYQGETQRGVVCSGLQVGGTIHVIFRGRRSRQAFVRKYCRSYGYTECPVSKMLDEHGEKFVPELRSDDIDLGEAVEEENEQEDEGE